MALVTGITKTVEIPKEQESAVIRKLSHRQLKEAAKARQSEGISFMKEIGAELMKALQDGDDEKLKKLEEAQQANINNYDRDTLLSLGVVSWTYKAELPKALEDLDEATAKFLAAEIFALSRPETAAEAKNV